MKDRDTWRVFCAVEIPTLARDLVLQHIERLRKAVHDAKASWSRDSNLHLTLKFLGDIPQTSAPKLSDATSRAVAGVAPFAIRLEGSGVFPNQRQPRVLWIGIKDPSESLKKLQSQLEREASHAGFERDERAFHPHLTLARLRHPKGARQLAQAHLELEFEPVEVLVSELLVIRSDLSSAGSKYTTISQHAFGATAIQV